MFIFLVAVDQPCLCKLNYTPRTKGVLDQAKEKGCNEILCGRIKIKTGALPEVYQWFQTLKERKEELIQAFSYEGVWLEVECWKNCCEECIVLEPLFDLQRKNVD